MELSCLQLGFYLASWGMFRGSSVLLQRSVKHYVPTIEVIVAARPEIWEIDANCYSDEAIELITDTAKQIRMALPDRASDILVTKIMLGVFGCVPALDNRFRKSFGVWTLGRMSLRKIASFYAQNAEIIEAHRVLTIDFATGAPTKRRYSRAKVIDMVFYVEGGARTTDSADSS
jgi:hypothetical protein